MKKLTVILALVLCLVLCVFAFASCKKDKKGTATTAKGTAAPSTTAAPATTEAEETQEPHVCTPGDYEVDFPATCSAKGQMSKYCTECGQLIPNTTIDIEIDPDAHKVDEWITVEPTLLHPNGSKTGTCSLCNTPFNEELVFKPYAFLSTWNATERAAFNTENKVDWLDNKELTDGIYIRKHINKIKDEDTHYYPTDVEPLGNDLLVEVSYLWNSTMTSGGGYTAEPLTFAHADGYDVFHVGAKLDAKDNRTKDAAGNAGTYEYTYVTPTPAAIAANSSVKKPSLGDYGWHRLGFRIHQEADIDNGAVKYTYVASAYVDGTLVLAFDLADWTSRAFNKTVTGLLFTAEINEEDNTKLDYYDVGNDPKSGFTNSFGLFIVEDFFKSTTSTAYVVLGDLSMTCGQDFVQEVEPNADPEDGTFTLNDNGTPDDTTDDITCPAKIWYKEVIH